MSTDNARSSRSKPPDDAHRLRRTFEQARKEYFPRWDRLGEWSLQVGTPTHSVMGYCDVERKTICVHESWVYVSDRELLALLVHEVCHAVASEYHGERFRARLLKAAEKAEYLADWSLGQALRNEATSLCDAERPTARSVYGTVSDALWDEPDAPLADVIAWVADSFGYTAQELLRRYPKLPRVYERESRSQEGRGF